MICARRSIDRLLLMMTRRNIFAYKTCLRSFPRYLHTPLDTHSRIHHEANSSHSQPAMEKPSQPWNFTVLLVAALSSVHVCVCTSSALIVLTKSFNPKMDCDQLLYGLIDSIKIAILLLPKGWDHHFKPGQCQRGMYSSWLSFRQSDLRYEILIILIRDGKS